MSEMQGSGEQFPPGDGAEELPESRAPHRVIGTPPPARARTLLEAPPQEDRPPERWLPAEPPDRAQAKRAERLVAALFILSMLASIGFIAAYVGLEVHSVGATARSNLALGISMSVAFGALAVGAVIWVRYLMPDVELTEERKPLASSRQQRAEFEETFTEGAEASGFAKRPLVRRTLIAASVALAIPPIVLLRDMGPLPGTSLRHTVWRRGMRLLVFGPNTPLRPADFAIPGQMITVVPDGYQDNQDALAKATTIILKFGPGQLKPPTVMNWTVDGIVAYSKICTHVGCPVALYEQTTHHILCPCHQSTFDAARGAQVIFGPAARPLPQLPLSTDAAGFLVAASDYHEPVGPSFWERG
ncbi:MAG TPA: Rieske 2Fe-2S domain-containing protein [Streptosporangiaceae bacterium]|nr:Rieske 2Fe-2S domain-containing protein [Streptosporangiaceae bacterium]